MFPNKFHITALLILCCWATSVQTYATRAPETADLTSMADTARVLPDIVVTGTRTMESERHIAATVTSVNRQQLTLMEQPSLLKTLSETVPNLFVTSRGMVGYGVSDGAAGGISVRGMGSGAGRVMVLIDGHPQYQGVFGHAIADAYQTMVAERIEVVRGPGSVLYGSNAMGGVVNIITRQQQEGIHSQLNLAAGSFGTTQAELNNQIRIGRFFSTVAVNHQHSDNHRDDMDFTQYGGFVKLGYELTPHLRAWASANLTHFEAAYPGATHAPILEARQWVNRGVAEAEIENHFGRTSGSLSLYHNFGRHKINDGHAPADPAKDYYFRSNDALTGINLYQGVRLFTGNWTTIGFDYQRIYGHAWEQDMATGDTRLNTPRQTKMNYPLDKTLHEVAAYADVRQDLTSWLSLEGGIRWDHHSQVGTELVPQGGIVVRTDRHSSLKATVGKGFRVPSLREMYLYPPRNEELKPERLWNYEVAWKHHLFPGFLTYGINLFYLKAENLIQNIVQANPFSGTGRMNVNTGEVENYGAEFEAQLHVNRYWSLQTNHSYLHMSRKLLAAPQYKGYVGISAYVPAHDGLSDSSFSRWELNVGAQYLAGLYLDCDDDTWGDAKQNVCLLNALIAYRPVASAKLWMRGENLLAQHYEIMAGYPMPRTTVMAGISINF